MPQSALKVLVVDDQLPVRQLVGNALSRAGYHVQCAADAAEAIRLSRGQVFDLVISDWKMPGMDGVELLAHLCALGQARQAILMSGYPTDALKTDLPASWSVLAKPFTPKRLLAVVRDATRDH